MRLTLSRLVFVVQCLALWPLSKTCAYVTTSIRLQRFSSKLLLAVDPLRAATGIRPSLHPVTINAIAEALRIRARKDTDSPIRVSDDAQPLEVAVTAGKIAAAAIEKRQQASNEDGMILEADEEQTIAGRVVGVVMRFDDLENKLWTKCQTIGWIAKYSEWDSFGILSDETTSTVAAVDERVQMDPLFSMNRAECLLALFLHTVEAPSLLQRNVTVPGGSIVNFLDTDRLEVLLSE